MNRSMSTRVLYPRHFQHKKKNVRFDARRSARIKKSLIVFFIVFGTGIAVSALRYSALQVRTIDIRGLEAISDARIRESVRGFLAGSYGFFLPRSSYFLVSPSALEKEIKKQTLRVERASVVKAFPDTVEIAIQERKPWAVFCGSISVPQGEKDVVPESSPCFYLDRTGFSYEEAPESSGSLLLGITGDRRDARIGAFLIDSKTLESMILIGDRVERTLGARVVAYELSEAVPSEVRARLDKGFTVIFKKEDNFEEAFGVLKRVLDEEIRDQYNKLAYIDLRFGNKVFYKFR